MAFYFHILLSYRFLFPRSHLKPRADSYCNLIVSPPYCCRILSSVQWEMSLRDDPTIAWRNFHGVYLCGVRKGDIWGLAWSRVKKQGLLLGWLYFIYRGADKSLARPTSRCILFDGENISFDASLVIHIYTGCHRRKGPNFGRVFLMLNYTDITQSTYIQSWTVTEIMAREVWNFDGCYTLTDCQIHIETGRNMWFL